MWSLTSDWQRKKQRALSEKYFQEQDDKRVQQEEMHPTNSEKQKDPSKSHIYEQTEIPGEAYLTQSRREKLHKIKRH